MVLQSEHMMLASYSALPLAFGLVSPLFMAAGAGLVSVPILIHILNRRRFKIIDWAAMDFLLKAMRKNRKRIRFEQWLLLAARCLLLMLLGFALARPLGGDDANASAAGQRSGLHVIVINNSFSMGYDADRPGAKTHLDQAKIIAKQLIHRLSSGGESVAIITAARPATAVIASPTYDLSAAEAAVQRIQQSYSDIDEAGALAKARDIAAAETKQPNKTLDLIDDSTRSGWAKDAEAIQQTGKELAGLFTSGITHFNLGKANQWNDAIVDLPASDELVTSTFENKFTADVRAFGPAIGDPHITWKWDDELQPPGAALVKATDAKAPVTISVHSNIGGVHVLSAVIQSDDRLQGDNTRSRIVNVASHLKVLIVEGERGIGGQGSSGAFLDAALASPGLDGKKTSYADTDRISDLELSQKVFYDYRCIYLCGVGNIQESTAVQLEKYVRQGGTLVIFMGDPVTAENYNATLLKHGLLPGSLIKRMSVSGDQTPFGFDFDPHVVPHAILRDFYNQENTGMENAQVYRYWQVGLAGDSKVERVLNFKNPGDKTQLPDPAITVQTVGKGRVLFYATSADPNSEWTTFMAHQAYISMMHMMLLGTVNSGDVWMNLAINDRVVVPPSIKLNAAPVLRDSTQVEIPMESVSDADGQTVYQSGPMIKPGVFTLSTGTEVYKIAVNIPGEACDVRTIDDGTVKKALGDIDMHLEADSVPPPTFHLHEGADYGWRIMVGVLVLLAAECAMAMHFGHYRRK